MPSMPAATAAHQFALLATILPHARDAKRNGGCEEMSRRMSVAFTNAISRARNQLHLSASYAAILECISLH